METTGNYNLDFYLRLKEAFLKAKVGKAEEVAHGTCESFSDYKAQTGQIEGLNQALYILERVADDLRKEDE